MDKKRKILIAICLCLCSLFSFFISCVIPNVAYANVISDATAYSDVIEDLQKDENFNASDYEIDKTDKSLYVIQVAESSNKELFVYVYQPCSPDAELNATTINISTGINQNLSYKNYKLILINSSGCLYKYKVKDFIVSETETRYYDISSIFRKWNGNYDENTNNDNTISEVSFAVNKQFTFQTTEDGLMYGCQDIETIKVIDKYVGFVRYKNNNAPEWLSNSSVDSHFVAFTTDKDIDLLMEADVYYSKQQIKDGELTGVEYGAIQKDYAYLKYTNEIKIDNSSPLDWLFGNNKYSWNEIQSIDEFFKENTDLANVYSFAGFNITGTHNLTEQGKQDLEGKEWVLRFVATDYIDGRENVGLGGSLTTGAPLWSDYEQYTSVGDVTIMRLKFKTDGIVYNLGVIDNKQTGDGIPDNYYERKVEPGDWLKTILAVLLVILLVIVLWPILPVIINIIITILKFIFKVVIWVISLPFNLISFAFKKRE